VVEPQPGKAVPIDGLFHVAFVAENNWLCQEKAYTHLMVVEGQSKGQNHAHLHMHLSNDGQKLHRMAKSMLSEYQVQVVQTDK